ncbi:protein GAMETE EXPRESSED 1 [Humulus lupulus]|uniref:protein GAMETE EXPRESSED 1 n=1 Tax=Humulus lupulus TaxID=3486 RepID=UPI002B4047CE|nr:protein GAMETE EXPRESSED 1 [Humulus lupulus]
MGQYDRSLLCLLIILSMSTTSMSWLWSSPSSSSSANTAFSGEIYTTIAELSIDDLNGDDKGIQRVKNAKTKLKVGSNSCWYEAYQGIFAACSEIAGDDNEKRKKFAWDLSNCFQKDSGRPSLPSCRTGSSMKECLQKLDDNAIHTYRGFFLETNSICHQLQSDIFRRQTERLVNDLKKSAENAEERLETIQEKSEHLLQDTKDIHNSMTSIEEQTQQVLYSTSEIGTRITDISKQSEAVFEQSQKISASQIDLEKGQEVMKVKLEEGIAMLHESYHNLDKEIGGLRDGTVKIEKEINRVGDSMSSKMNILQNKADDIGNVAGVSLEKQKEVLKGQSEALNGLQLLTQFQSKALEESRGVMQQLANFGHEQQEELLRRQEKLQQAHDHLVENSKSMLAAQESFEQKQAALFVALDKLFALHNALLLESRLIKAFFIYSISMFVLYLFTSTKQTYPVRHRLYLGLCCTFLMEFAILRITTNGIEQQTWLINLVRLLFLLVATVQILHAIFTFRDYEMLNYGMLKQLTEEVRSLRKNAELSWETESDVDWSTWVDHEIPDGIDNIIQDPDYMIGFEERVGESSHETSSSTGSRYNLRSRRRP